MPDKAVLVIDDDQIASDTLRMLLEFEGFTVCTCESGVRALDVIGEERFAAVLIDYRLPEMKGDEVTRLIWELCPELLLSVSAWKRGEALFWRPGQMPLSKNMS